MEEPHLPDEKTKSTRELLGTFMHHKVVHAVSMCLLLIDAILVLFLLLVDLDVIPVSVPSKKEKVEHGLHYTGLAILSIFVIEITLKIIADGSAFFKNKLEVFDGAVVLISFVLDISLSVAHVDDIVRDAVILMILLRLWRFFKLIVSVNTCVRKDIQGKVDAERERRVQAEKERDDALEKLKKVQNECQRSNGPDRENERETG
ncbi:voltage-gated hydrogen channel 1-like [Argopecten irradians]|uniref:voltage-gated hydrogen channel 1-like n=1 Tax=Argopecten irradians TaxID=31199 RepID=UPI0037142881